MSDANHRPGDAMPGPNIRQLLTTALTHHREGRLAEAETSCRTLLAIMPDQPDALHLQGIIASQRGRPEEAVKLIGRAIALTKQKPLASHHNNIGLAFLDLGQTNRAIDHFKDALALKPDYAAAHYNLGNSFKAQGKLDEAAARFRRAAELKPDYAEAHNNLGSVLREQEKLDEAAISYERAIAANPGYVEAYQNLALLRKQQGRLEEARGLYERLLAIRPDFLLAYVSLASVLQTQRKLDEAAACYRNLLARLPDDPDAHGNLGGLLMEQGKIEEAAQHYERALALRPDQASAHNNLGIARLEAQRLDDAVGHFEAALALEPDHAEAHNNLGIALMNLGQFDESQEHFARALALRPDYASAHNNMGALDMVQGRFAEAAMSYERALAVDETFHTAHYNLGIVREEGGRFQDALSSYLRAQEIKPDHADSHWNEALVRLLLGDFEAGWKKYEWRWATEEFHLRQFVEPRWDGGDFVGKSLFIHAEQGVGDTIQFVRYAPLVKARGGRVILECVPSLERLMRTVEGIDDVVPLGQIPPSFDLQVPLLSLPGLFKAGIDAIPTTIPYLHPNADSVDSWRARLAGKEGPKIGLAWRGNPKHRNDRRRSIPGETLAQLCKIPGVNWVNLQVDATPDEIAALGPHVYNAGPLLTDWAETAALVSCLDLVVTVDTGVAHLAGALGRTAWVLLSQAPDWRWLLDRGDSAWYPTLRLFRQTEAGNWDDVVARVALEIPTLGQG